MNASDPEQVFLQEAQDLLEQLEQALLDLERTPGDGELIDKAFRALHTIKGSGAMFGFDAVAAFTHQFETAFDLVRKGQVTPTRELIAVALAAKDQMRVLIDHPAQASASASEIILGDLQRVMAAASSPPAAGDTSDALEGAPDDGEVTWCVRFRLPADAMVTGTNPLLLLDELHTLGTASVFARTDGVPPLEEIDPTLSYLRWTVMLRTDQPRSAIEQVFLFVLDEMELEIERAPNNAVPGAAASAKPVRPAQSAVAQPVRSDTTPSHKSTPTPQRPADIHET
ncbi:MAG: Hpt domain-containing protein, partial [Acetobacteraceae bacterium]